MAIDSGTGPLDPDAGKIVVVAGLKEATPTEALVRFNANGSLDASFGGGAGYVTLGTPHGNPSVAVGSDNRIVVAGRADDGASTGYDIALARLNADGTPDTTFGSAGVVVAPLPGDQVVRSMTIQPDGKIVVAGNEDQYNFMAARFNPADGSLDSSFGVNGLTVTTGNQVNFASVDVALEPDGRIVVAESSRLVSPNSFALARFLATGPQIGSFTTSSNTVPSGSSLTLTAANITDGNPGSNITQVEFYYFDGSGNKVSLGYATQTSPGVWSLTFTVSLAPGTYTLFAQAKDNYGVFSDPLSLTLQVL
jgi:uncharacterized delta-60 repeat protein